ncbi:hypothetical protein DRO22_03935, partial [Candidatus Bathyarchaeota archaeon]
NVWEWVTGEREERREYITSIYGGYVWCRDEEYAYIANLEGGDARLHDLREDPEQRENIAQEKLEICEKMYKRILSDAGGVLPRYRIRRPDLPWYDSAWI